MKSGARIAVLVVVALVAVGVGTLLSVGSHGTSQTTAATLPAKAKPTKPKAAPRPPAGSTSINLAGKAAGPAVPNGFVGLATEFWDVEKLEGTNPNKPDTAFEHLLEGLAPGSTPYMRVGGDSTDWTWWPVPGMKKPPWVHMSLTPNWAAVMKRLTTDTKAKLMLGIEMEADNPKISNYEASQLSKRIGVKNIDAYEVGNEPELYYAFPFYKVNGQKVRGRQANYNWGGIAPDWSKMAGSLPKGGPALAGPGWAMPNALPHNPPLMTQRNHPATVTLHTYPLKAARCTPGQPPLTEADLFKPSSLQGLAGVVGQWTRQLGKYHAKLRAAEMNAITCNGDPKISNSFGPALWALNILADYVGTGDSGVNFDFEPQSSQHLIRAKQTKSGWTVQVNPTYYGLLAFGQAAPAGSQMIPMPKLPAGIIGFAAKTKTGQTNVVLTNTNAKAQTINVNVPGAKSGASLRLLSAKGGVSSGGPVTLGGQSISPTTGQLAGKPVSHPVTRTSKGYSVPVPGNAAAIVNVG
ncbi:MAG: hypothetical protein J2O48_10215 [Solirubrobacterales bacterium]|nr:hypothetical protein [Solirubrobacterales bacterium]